MKNIAPKNTKLIFSDTANLCSGIPLGNVINMVENL